ncbi:MAG: DUF6033 family protein, partial [Planctomycetes bacterium]|nr:DUF6033 family protein [Planctomycetota bacterium]
MSAISGVSGTNAASAAAQADKSNAVTIQQLKKQYPHLKLSAQAFGSEAAVKSYAMNQTGKYNVAIHPKALDRMGSDETFSEKIHETLGGAKEYQDKLESMIEASGAKLIACGQYIDENGNCGSWSVSQTSSEGPGLVSAGKTQKQLLQQI